MTHAIPNANVICDLIVTETAHCYTVSSMSHRSKKSHTIITCKTLLNFIGVNDSFVLNEDNAYPKRMIIMPTETIIFRDTNYKFYLQQQHLSLLHLQVFV
jgi:hypothetical protein